MTFDQSDEETRLKKIFDKDIDKDQVNGSNKDIPKDLWPCIEERTVLYSFLLLTISLLFVIDIEYLGEYGLNRHKTTITKNKVNIEILEK